MNITVITSSKAVESANCILGQAIQQLLEREDLRKQMDLSLTNVQDAEAFRKSLLKGFLNRKKA